jgi:uncharacterized protein YyaL (SSP411 family)
MPNHLRGETSPYLLQHANNPVDWYPWGAEALRLAHEQNKPILLSVGYSACHWCHVMAHESFEDEETATLMNTLFINIKVDREERPDLDQIYQTAHYMITQRNGGWPLTMFLTPDQLPFFGGTYFPKTPRYNLPGFKDVLPQIADFYHKNRDNIAEHGGALLEAFEQTVPAFLGEAKLSRSPMDHARLQLSQSYDRTHGGFGSAPKFPHPFDLEFLLRHYHVQHDRTAMEMVEFTLKKMTSGGIYDQIGGGFCRYSVDERWMIPHFEKMLYDNAPLLCLCVDMWLVTGDARFKQVAEETAAWVLREMQSPKGGYYSTLDADSEHEEGKFYVWTPAEIQALLAENEYKIAAACFGLDSAPNFESQHWHLHVARDVGEVAAESGLTLEQATQWINSARAKLFNARERRVRPGRDEKILASWNGLMIKAMAHAGRVLGRAEWIDSARRALGFVQTTLWSEGRLFATYKDGKAHLNAYLDDYAFLLDALLELIEADFRVDDLEFARQLAEVLLTRFEDTVEGGFFFTSHDHEKLISRPKPGHDNATPSGNGIAAHALLRLGHLLGEARYLGSSERTLALFYPHVARHPGGYMSLIKALSEILNPPQVIILRGLPEPVAQWKQKLAAYYLPTTMVIAIPGDTRGLPEALDKPAIRPVAAWVCEGGSCLSPIEDFAELKRVCKVT